MDKMLNYLFPECDVAFEIEYVELKSRAAEAFNQGGTTAEASIDSYRLGIRPCLSGIPIYMDMGYRMDGKKFDGMIWGRFWPIWNMESAYFDFANEESFELSACWMATDHVIEEDVTLAAWNEVQKQIEKEIENGTIRNVYALKLGYACYLDEQEGRFALYPVWVCDCDYVENSKEEIAVNPWDDDFRRGFSFKELVFDGRTGEKQKNVLDNRTDYFLPQL